MAQVADIQDPEATDIRSDLDPRQPISPIVAEHKDRQVCHIQRILMFYLNAKDTDPKLVPQLACAWERLENRLNRIRMKPEPKPVDTTVLDKRKAKSQRVASTDPSITPG
jgi:hypothetical protein